MAKTYRQFCPLAYALERVGERWTGLILRDLAAGPKRYTDLLDGLPGIGTSVLASRLDRLEADGLARKIQVGPPTPAQVYDLTDSGRELFRALLPLAAWGGQHLADAEPLPHETIPASSIAMSLAATFDPDRAAGIAETYEFDVDDNIVTVVVDRGTINAFVGAGPATPDAKISTTSRVLFDIGFGRRDASEAVRAGHMDVSGTTDALTHCYELFGPSRLLPPKGSDKA